MRKVKDINLASIKNLNDLLEQMKAMGGFQGNKLVNGIQIIEKMIRDKKSLNFLSFPACLVSTGIRGVLKTLIKRKWFDVIITTCGTLDHDLARVWGDYYQGSFDLDDKKIKEKGFSRLGNVLVPDEVYAEKVESNVQKFLEEMHAKGEKELATYEFVWELGKRISSKESLLYWANEHKIPIIVPGITDGMIGYQAWLFSQEKEFKLNVLKDESLLNEKIWDAKTSGGFIIGGGISKHHLIWWNQFKGGLNYAVYLTSAVEWDGSLSGARPKEAISWKKIDEQADKVFIWGEASSILPFMVTGLINEMER